MLFTITLHHGGKIEGDKYKNYNNGKVTYIDIVDGDTFSIPELNRMVMRLGYPEKTVLLYHYIDLRSDINRDLRDLRNDTDVIEFLGWVRQYKVMEIYYNHLSL